MKQALLLLMSLMVLSACGESENIVTNKNTGPHLEHSQLEDLNHIRKRASLGLDTTQNCVGFIIRNEDGSIAYEVEALNVHSSGLITLIIISNEGVYNLDSTSDALGRIEQNGSFTSYRQDETGTPLQAEADFINSELRIAKLYAGSFGSEKKIVTIYQKTSTIKLQDHSNTLKHYCQ